MPLAGRSFTVYHWLLYAALILKILPEPPFLHEADSSSGSSLSEISRPYYSRLLSSSLQYRRAFMERPPISGTAQQMIKLATTTQRLLLIYVGYDISRLCDGFFDAHFQKDGRAFSPHSTLESSHAF